MVFHGEGSSAPHRRYVVPPQLDRYSPEPAWFWLNFSVSSHCKVLLGKMLLMPYQVCKGLGSINAMPGGRFQSKKLFKKPFPPHPPNCLECRLATGGWSSMRTGSLLSSSPPPSSFSCPSALQPLHPNQRLLHHLIQLPVLQPNTLIPSSPSRATTLLSFPLSKACTVSKSWNPLRSPLPHFSLPLTSRSAVLTCCTSHFAPPVALSSAANISLCVV